MNIQTKYLGDVEVSETKIIEFSSGLPGFIEHTKFVLLNLPENSVFQVLQSTETPSIAFIVTNPYHFYQDYMFDLDNNIVENLRIESDKDVIVLAIVTLKEPFNKSTMNLKAPIIMNLQHKRGKQYILNMEDYPSKAAFVPSASSTGKGE